MNRDGERRIANSPDSKPRVVGLPVMKSRIQARRLNKSNSLIENVYALLFQQMLIFVNISDCIAKVK